MEMSWDCFFCDEVFEWQIELHDHWDENGCGPICGVCGDSCPRNSCSGCDVYYHFECIWDAEAGKGGCPDCGYD